MLIVSKSFNSILGVTDITVGKVYAAHVSSDWHRVKVFIYSCWSKAAVLKMYLNIVGGIHSARHLHLLLHWPWRYGHNIGKWIFILWWHSINTISSILISERRSKRTGSQIPDHTSTNSNCGGVWSPGLWREWYNSESTKSKSTGETSCCHGRK